MADAPKVRKLVLKKETIAHLDRQQMERVAGGTVDPTLVATCPGGPMDTCNACTDACITEAATNCCDISSFPMCTSDSGCYSCDPWHCQLIC